MSKLENLIPRLEMCKEIPEGAFTDSALVRIGGKRCPKLDILPRESLQRSQLELVQKGSWHLYPAPTLEEVLAELPTSILSYKGEKYYLAIFDARNKSGMWQIGYLRLAVSGGGFDYSGYKARAPRLVDAARELWIMLGHANILPLPGEEG